MNMFKCFMFGFLLFFTGCTNLAKPETFNQKLVYAYATAESVAKTAADLLERKVISVEKALAVDKELDNAKLILTSARIAESSGDTNNAASLLLKANAILINLEKQLKGYNNGTVKSGNSGKWFSYNQSSLNQYRFHYADSV